jgi:putative nucleotidyltransferase with HDIG domain
MLGAGELCVRLLGDGIGDKAALHPLNVTIVSLLMGCALGWGEADLVDLGVGAMLHDIGKLDLPERVRQRSDHFSPSEQRAYEEHVARGVAQAARMGLGPGATLIIAQHHEHADGTGFPQKLGADRMTAAARLVALVNRYDKLCNPPLGQRPLTPHEALSLLFAQHRERYDTSILAAFIKLMGVYPPGSVVQLTDDRYGMVVGVNAARPLKTRVRVHDEGVPASEALVLDLEHEPDLGVRRSISPLSLPADAARTLAPRQRIAYFFEASVPPGAA